MIKQTYDVEAETTTKFSKNLKGFEKYMIHPVTPLYRIIH
jgi:hypothetical protein